MKKLLTVTIFLLASLFSFSQAKNDSLPPKPPATDTVDASKSKIIKINNNLFLTEALRQSKYFLSEQNLNVLFDRLVQLPYAESARAIDIIKQFFGIK